MIKYWPYAVVRKGKNNNDLQYSYQAQHNTKECIETIKLWEEHYNMDIVSAYIDIEEDGRITKRIPVVKEWVIHSEDEVLNPLAYVEVGKTK